MRDLDLRRIARLILFTADRARFRAEFSLWTGTELMFSGVFNELAPEQIVALCSCLVFEEKVSLCSLLLRRSSCLFTSSAFQSEETVKAKDELAGPLRQMQYARI
jgi:superfamily II RNA helicase